ncbi:MAG TPA: glycosyltransferase family A protein [Dokdonella sp.]|nr:glycosyltransferase family A protein [Dokdonella sp.]HNS27387.1 glycosyltransferase family A protein [Steroidobacteraceae bacterium]
MLQVLTTTGCRPEAFALCARWMARQTFRGQVRWIVVDDGEEPTPMPAELPENWCIDVVRPMPFWREGDRTQPRNFVAGLDAALQAPVVVVEDDDWYAADYLETCAARLREHDLVGVGPQRWANVRLQRVGAYRAAWPWTSSMAFNGRVIEHLRAIAASREAYVDRDGWELYAGRKRYFPDGRVVGIKGLPGRGGYMPCHHQPQGSRDPGLRMLERWIGSDVEAYREFR